MIDDVDHARNHREAIIKVDEFVSRISKEFVNVVEQRNKTKGEAKEGHLKLAEEGQYYIDAYKYVRYKDVTFSMCIRGRNGWLR